MLLITEKKLNDLKSHISLFCVLKICFFSPLLLSRTFIPFNLNDENFLVESYILNNCYEFAINFDPGTVVSYFIEAIMLLISLVVDHLP